MNYQEIRPSLKTGDLVLFSGRGFVSRMIQLGTRSKASHVGMVVAHKELDLVLIVESTSLYRKRDMWKGKFVSGVQLHPLGSRITDYKGRVYIRPLKNPFSASDKKKLFKFLREMRHLPYPSGIGGKMRVILSGFHLNSKGATGIWCSQFIARIFKEVKRFNPIIEAYNVNPADLTSERDIQKGVWGKEERIK